MRTHLRRAATLLVAAAALALAPVVVSSGPVAAAPACPAGTNWDAVLKACVPNGPTTVPAP
jgi:hypothetical protein